MQRDGARRPAPALPAAPQAMQHQVEHAGLTWLDLVYPEAAHAEHLRERFGFHPLHLEDMRARTQRPKVDDSPEPEYSFIIVHFPVFNEMTRLSVLAEVDIFVGRDFVVTTHDARLRPLVRLVQLSDSEKARPRLMEGGSGFLLYRILETLIKSCFPMVARLDEKVDWLEERIFSADTRRSVEELSFLRRDIMSMRRIIRPNLPVLRSLSERERDFLRLDEGIYFGDLVDDLARIWDMLEEQKEIIEGLDATLASLTSHRINREMKAFTLISVIFLPMTLIASILGMNVVLPFADHPMALPVTIAAMLLIGGAMLLFFRRSGWI